MMLLGYWLFGVRVGIPRSHRCACSRPLTLREGGDGTKGSIASGLMLRGSEVI